MTGIKKSGSVFWRAELCGSREPVFIGERHVPGDGYVREPEHVREGSRRGVKLTMHLYYATRYRGRNIHIVGYDVLIFEY